LCVFRNYNFNLRSNMAANPVDQFTEFESACKSGDLKKAKYIYPSVREELAADRIVAIFNHCVSERNFPLCYWLLGLPEFDANFKIGITPHPSILHTIFLLYNRLPVLPVVILLTKLSSEETLNSKVTVDNVSGTVLDVAVENGLLTSAIYLSWLGIECKDQNKKYTDISLQTWLDEGLEEDAVAWAVAANDIKSLRFLADNIKDEDKKALIQIAEVFGYHEIKCFLKGNTGLKIYLEQIFPDFEIVWQDKTFPCHKSFLAGNSDMFKVMIENKIRQSLEMKTELLNCPDEVVAESFLKFFYMEKIDKNILAFHGVSFLHLSDYYQVRKLKNFVEDEMQKILSKENVKEFFIAGDMYNGNKLKNAAIEFLSENRGVWKENVEEWQPYISHDLLCELVTKLL